jgi:hypothetical protein
MARPFLVVVVNDKDQRGLPHTRNDMQDYRKANL